MTTDKRKQLVGSLENKEYRDAFAAETVNTGLAFQIRLLRDARKWNQEDLAKAAGKAQPTVSQLEDPNYGRYSLTTLKKLASAFDVALLVKFVPFSRLVDETLELTPEALAPKSFDQDTNLYSGNLPVVSASMTIPAEAMLTVGYQEIGPWAEVQETVWATTPGRRLGRVTGGVIYETADQGVSGHITNRSQLEYSGWANIAQEDVTFSPVAPDRELANVA